MNGHYNSGSGDKNVWWWPPVIWQYFRLSRQTRPVWQERKWEEPSAGAQPSLFHPNTTYYTTTLHITPPTLHITQQHYIFHPNTTYYTTTLHIPPPTLHITQHNYIFHPNTTYSTPTLHITQHNYIFVGYPTKSVFVAFLVFNIDFRLTSRTASKLIHSLYCTVCSYSKLIFYVARKSLRLTVLYCTMYSIFIGI